MTHDPADEEATSAREGVELALAALRYRDLSERDLERKLKARGVPEVERARAVDTLRRTGLLDDLRFACAKAETLAARGAGDTLVRDSLRRAGVPAEVLDEALAGLGSEEERARAIVARRGASPRTARYLAGKGFSPDAIAAAVASHGGDALG